MIEHLGLGVELTLQDNMSRRVDPLIRELDRLKRQSQETTAAVDQSNRNLFGSFERHYKTQRVNDFNKAMQSTGSVALGVSERLIKATEAADKFQSSMNRAQSAGNFNQMYQNIRRVHEQLGVMGFGMTKMQEQMADDRAYNVMKYQMRDLEDRIQGTRKAIEEMQLAPDSSRFRDEIALAQNALKAYEQQLKEVNSLDVLARTNNAEVGNFRGQNVMYRPAEAFAQRTANRLLGLSMMDMAIAADYSYKALDKTAKLMAGTGYTYEEQRKKITQLTGALTTMGIALSTTVTLGVVAGTVAVVGFAKAFEEAEAQFQARTLSTNVRMDSTLSPSNKQGGIRNEMSRVWVESGADWNKVSTVFSDIELTMGKMPTQKLGEIAEYGLMFNSVWGDLKPMDAIKSASGIMDKYGVSTGQALDILTLGLKESNGDLEKSGTYINNNIGALKRMTEAGNEGAQAFETMSSAMEGTPTARLFAGFRQFSIVVKELWESGLGEWFGKVGDGIYRVSSAMTTFLQNNEGMARFIGYAVGITATFLALAGPVALVTGTLLRFRGLIEGVSASIFGLSKGGMALLSPQAMKAKESMDAFTLAFARFPNTLLATVPLFYNFVRGIPYFIANLAKANPMMAALAGVFTAYQLNLFGVADSIDRVRNRVRESWDLAKQIVGSEIKFDKIEDYDRLTQVFSKIRTMGTIVGNVIRDWGEGSVMFSGAEVDLIKKLNMDGFANFIVDTSGKVERFWKGFKDGFTSSLGVAVEFGKQVWDKWEERLKTLGDLLLGFMNNLNKMFGGTGDMKTLNESMDKMLGMKDGLHSLGQIVGSIVFGFLAFKGVNAILSAIQTPFNTLGSVIDKTAGKLRSLRALFALGGIIKTPTVVSAPPVSTPGGNSPGGGGNNGNGNGNPSDPSSRTAPTMAYATRPFGNAVPTIPHNPSSQPVASNNPRHYGAPGTVIYQGASSPLPPADPTTGTRPPGSPTPVTGVGTPYGPAMAMGMPLPESDSDARNRREGTVRERATRRMGRRGLGTLVNNETASRIRGAGGQVGTDGRYRGNGQNRQVFARNQGFMSRALLGQRYDTYDNNGRRRTLGSQGGLLRSRANDARLGDRSTAGRRASVQTRRTVRNAQNRVGRALSPVTRRVDGAVSRVGNAARTAGGAVGRAARPVTVPVRYVAGRLNTSGALTQARTAGRTAGTRFTTAFRTGANRLTGGRMFNGAPQAGTRAGRQSGNAFTRAFRTSARTQTAFSAFENSAGRVGGRTGRRFARGMTGSVRAGMGVTRLFGGLAKGVGTVGRRAGGGLIRGLGMVVTKGLPFIFKLGLRAIPFLGWAIMAWDIISVVFTNWDKIKAGAKKAWDWIKTDGKKMALDLMTTIKEKSLDAWKYMKDEGFKKMGEFVESAGATLLELGAKGLEVGAEFGKKLLDTAMSYVGDLTSQAGAKLGELGSSALSKINPFDNEKGGGTKKARGGIVNAPTFGVIGEHGAEAIIPLSGNMRGYASGVLQQTAAILGMDVVKRTTTNKESLPSHSGMSENQVDAMFAMMNGNFKAYANGGIVNKPHYGLVGEAGEEAIIPLTKKDRGLALWQQAGAKLGVRPYANGGIAGKASSAGAGSSSVTAKVSLGGNGAEQGDKLAKGFNQAVSKGLTGANLPMKEWKDKNIGKPMNRLVSESSTYAENMVRSFSTAQASSDTGTKPYLDKQVHTPFRAVEKQSTSYAVDTIVNFRKAQNATSTNTNTYLNKEVHKPFTDAKDTAPKWGTGMMDSFVGGMRSKSSTVASAAKFLADQVEKAFREGLDIHSPSRVMRELGKYASIGIVEGLSSVDIKKFSDKQVEKMMASFGNFKGGGAKMASNAISTALRMLGKSQSFLPGLMAVARHESGFNPKAINNWDINAKRGDPSVGLFQIIGSTFAAHKYPGANDRTNPLHSALAAIRYLDARYGGIQNHPGLKSLAKGGGYKPYADGGIITHPHMGLVGEAGDEAIIPLTRKNRAMSLLQQVGTRLGLDITPKQNGIPSLSKEQSAVPARGESGASRGNVQVDNSITIQKLEVVFSKEASGVGEIAARKQAELMMKELQKIVKESRMRKGQKNLSLQDIILGL